MRAFIKSFNEAGRFAYYELSTPCFHYTAPIKDGSSLRVFFIAGTLVAAIAGSCATSLAAPHVVLAAGYVFSNAGAWARPLPANPPVAPQSQWWLDNIFSSQGYNLGRFQFEANAGGGSSDFTTPVYYGTNADPLYTIHCTMYSHCPDEGQQVRIPRGSRPSDGSDQHMAVVNFSANREDDFWKASKPNGNGGTLNIAYGGNGPLSGDGTGSFAATGSGVALTAGLLRAADLMAGFIPHALYVTTSCTSSQHVYPAVSSDGNNWNCPPQGTRIYLDLSADQIAALSVPQWTKTYLMGLHTYGGIISDHGGDSFGIMLESDYTNSVFGGSSPWIDFARFVQQDPASRNVWAYPYNNVYHIVPPTSGIDLRSHLKVLMPCVNTGTC